MTFLRFTKAILRYLAPHITATINTAELITAIITISDDPSPPEPDISS